MLSDILQVITGLFLLYFGGEFLVTGAEKLGRKIGFSGLIVGIVIVAFGTSAPELAVSLDAALTDNPDIALTNILGSNLANIGLVLALTTFIGGVMISRDLFKIDLSSMIIGFIAVAYFLIDNQLSRIEGILLLAGLISYITFRIKTLKHTGTATSVNNLPNSNTLRNCLLVIIGFGMLAIGGDVLVSGASTLAKDFGVSKAVIGFTIVAIGTSLPEIAASIAAVRMGHGEIAIGNVVGSNIWNSFGVFGITASIAPLTGQNIPSHMIYAMLIAGLILWGFCLVSARLKLVHGLILISGYFGYMIFAVL